MVDEKTWQDFINHAVTIQQLSMSTVKNTIKYLRYLVKNGIDLMADEETIKQQFFNFLSERIQAGRQPHSLNHYIKSMNRWMRFRGFETKFKKYREQYKPRRIPTTSDLKQLLKVIKDKMLRTIVYFLSMSGLRASELCNLNLDDIDWKNQMIIVRGKGNKIRYVPLPAKVLSGKNVPSLQNYIKYHRLNTDKKALFTTPSGRLTPARLRAMIKAAARNAGLPWLHTHSLRHYYATNLLRAGVNIRVVQELLGHTDIKTTGIYLHIIETDLKKAVENPNIEDPIRAKTAHAKKRGMLPKFYLKKQAGPRGLTEAHMRKIERHPPNFCIYRFSGGDDFAKW